MTCGVARSPNRGHSPNFLCGACGLGDAYVPSDTVPLVVGQLMSTSRAVMRHSPHTKIYATKVVTRQMQRHQDALNLRLHMLSKA